VNTVVELDARRLLCPMPVIRAQDRIKTMQPGEQLKVICTDPGATHDIPAWCRIHGHVVLDIEHQDREITIHIRVGKS